MAGRKAIFISGGGSGIGRAIALRFAREDWFVGLGDISEGGMAETAALLPPGQSSWHPLDVRDPAQWRQALSAFHHAAGGRIDVLANNAGVGDGGAITELSEEQIDRLIAVNFRGVVNGARAAHPYLKAAAPGSCLLNTASASAIYGIGGLSIYSATKFAVRSITEALDSEWADDGIKVRSLMPGFVDTPLLDGPASSGTNLSKRETVVAGGLDFEPIEDVAEAAWQAVHGQKIHLLVGKTARRMAVAARFLPGFLRKQSRALMNIRLGRT
jgi:NAD(P)-dependent dehydrogenase (short-subunit alcohol dehydrogenase family)